jgi:ABC-type amino acid transport substrate-binding protein
MRILVVLLVVIASLGSAFGLAQFSSGQSNSSQADPSKIPQFARKLIVAVKPLEPFVIKRGEKLEGFSIDLWDEIAKTNGWDFEYKYLSTVKDVLDQVKGGQADVGIAGISMTDERGFKFRAEYFQGCRFGDQTGNVGGFGDPNGGLSIPERRDGDVLLGFCHWNLLGCVLLLARV